MKNELQFRDKWQEVRRWIAYTENGEKRVEINEEIFTSHKKAKIVYFLGRGEGKVGIFVLRGEWLQFIDTPNM